jgi:membrane protease YdiL (CAAX protease family)
VATVVTVSVTLASSFVPVRWIAITVGGVFLTATWFLVLRRDDGAVEHAGIAFAGLVLPGDLDARRLLRALGLALGWTLVLALCSFGPFYLGFRAYARWIWHAHTTPWPALDISSAINEVLGQVGLIALPEEVFYRGYLQTRLDDAWPRRVRFLGAAVGPSVVVTSAIFALGHFLTIHDPGRLAVFFPSLLFGWLRARTGGVGAPIAFHACCNLFSAALFQAYGPH